MGEVFPPVEGSSLSGTHHRLPGTLAGDVNLLLIAFRRWQQRDVDTWLPVAAALTERYPQLAVYELPVISQWYRPVSGFIDGGMRAGIPDQDVRESTITLYINRSAFLSRLRIPSVSAIVPMLVARQGEILWRTTGPRSDTAEDDLAKTLAGM